MNPQTINVVTGQFSQFLNDQGVAGWQVGKGQAKRAKFNLAAAAFAPIDLDDTRQFVILDHAHAP